MEFQGEAFSATPGQDAVRSLLDQQGIRDLVHRYCHAADQQDSERLIPLFTPDGELVFDESRADPTAAPRTVTYRGTSELQNMPKPALRRGLHVTSNTVITVSGDDEASGVSYFLRLSVEDDGGYRVGNTGVYRDEYQRSSNGWLFRRREIHSLPLGGLDAALLRGGAAGTLSDTHFGVEIRERAEEVARTTTLETVVAKPVGQVSRIRGGPSG